MPFGSAKWRSPGRLVTLVAVLMLVVGALAIALKLSQSSRVPLGSNGVGSAAVIATLVNNLDTVCTSDTVVPAGTGTVALAVGYGQPSVPARLQGFLDLRGGERIPVEPASPPGGVSSVELKLARPVEREVRARLCVARVGAGPQVDILGATISRRAGGGFAYANGVSLGSLEPTVRFMAVPGKTTTGFQRLGGGLVSLSHLSPSGMSPFLIGLVLLVLVPASLALLLWNLATAPARSARRVGLWCVVGAFGITFTWATITPIFQGPDEPEHFAYAQHVATTGKRADPGRSLNRPPYSTQVDTVYSVLRHNAVVIDRGARNPLTATMRRDVNDADDLPRDDGGGFTESASGHSALYYALIAPAIKVAGDGLSDQLYAARLVTALLASLIAGFAAWAAALMVPGRRRAAALAGLAAATFPIAGSVGGTVNNDTLVNVVAAAAFVAVIGVLVKPSRSLWWYAAAGSLIAVLPIAKGSGFGVGAAFLVAVVVAGFLRRDPLQIGRAAAAAAAGGFGTLAVLAAASGLVDGQTLTLLNAHPVAPGQASAPVPLIFKIDYVLQLFVPFIHLKTDLYPPDVPLYRIYVLGTWGGFGWNRFYLPTSVSLATAAMTVVAVLLGFVGLYRERARLVGRKLAAVAVALTPLIGIAFVAYAYGAIGPRGVQPEQGRYLVIGLVPVALWWVAVPAVVKAGELRSALTGVVAGGLCFLLVLGLLVATGGWVA